MPRAYDPSTVEPKWQKKWAEKKVFDFDLKKAKDPYYTLVMFPYPSGARLHVGHWFQYSIPDSYCRFQRMRGKDVFHPMGFDAFGLPAENYAIKTGTPPAASTQENVDNMIEQFKRMGVMFDWEYALNTSHPDYYKWTQWLFLQMYDHELAYRKEANVNWCPKDQTVLANEQVWDGKCERCGTEVIQKPLTQWFWNITKYAEKLLDNLEGLDWPEKTKTMQRNWIGRSEGAEIMFEIDGIHRGVIGPMNWPPEKGALTGDLSRRLTDEWKRRIHSPRTIHLVFEPHQRREEFARSFSATIILRILQSVAERHTIAIHEAAVMPDHVHLLISFESGRHLENDIVKKLKGASAREFLKSIQSDENHLWGEGKHFEEVTSEVQFLNALTYIQENPQKSGISSEGRILSMLSETATVFTTRPDTLFGATYLVLAPEHPLVSTITTKDRRAAVENYQKEVEKKTELQRTDLAKSKTGEFTGAYAINPAAKEKIPVWIADYVVMRYGTGAIMAVPGHDERDHEFAQKFKLPIKAVVKGGDISKGAFTEDGTAMNSGFLDGLATPAAKNKMIGWLEKDRRGKGVVQYRLRDWLVSRQRYWGAPIPIVYDPEGNPHPIPQKHLPWLLPTDVEFKPTGKSPLTGSKEFVARTEKIFGKGWRPEYDTMDTFVCSSFYYLRFLMQNDQKKFMDGSLEEKWMPVDLYIGGPEHATMHLIYARFVMMALKDFGYVSHEEPFQRLVHQGLITNKGAKMSKSKNNVVSPDSFIERHGSDVFRMYLMFMGPFTDGGDWSDTGIKGIDRFVQRVWTILTSKKQPALRSPAQRDEEGNKKLEQDSPLQSGLHSIIKRVTEDIERMHFNTAISGLMEFLNALEKEKSIPEEIAHIFTILLAPLAPHLAEELWAELGGKGFVIDQEWPQYDPKKIVQTSFTIAVQVNGKLRGDIAVPATASKEEIVHAAKAHENVKKYLEGNAIKKEIYVPGKLVSFVV